MPEKILFFDTETTGFSSQARVIQLAWIYQNSEGETLGEHSHVIKPDGFDIPEKATAIHGISTQEALDGGDDLKEVINSFLPYALSADLLVGHNVAFDIRMMQQELDRGWMNDLKGIESFCTMTKATKFCGKRPKLQELYEKLFWEKFENAHDALADVRATVRCYWGLKNQGIIL